jgi:hypothetical protein
MQRPPAHPYPASAHITRVCRTSETQLILLYALVVPYHAYISAQLFHLLRLHRPTCPVREATTASSVCNQYESSTHVMNTSTNTIALSHFIISIRMTASVLSVEYVMHNIDKTFLAYLINCSTFLNVAHLITDYFTFHSSYYSSLSLYIRHSVNVIHWLPRSDTICDEPRTSICSMPGGPLEFT